MKKTGFTLIELSIVLVIIALIVGGVLVGKDLINAAAIRSQISQIEKYKTATNTFRVKYGYLPGDITAEAASAYGFVAHNTKPGEGDGNGYVLGTGNAAGTLCNNCEQGETAVFWVDLSSANLIDGYFKVAPATGLLFAPLNFTSSPTLYDYFPTAKIGQGNFVTVYYNSSKNYNYYAISAISSLGGAGVVTATSGLSVTQAQIIDSKIDDGLPQAGTVLANYLFGAGVQWSSNGSTAGPNSTVATGPLPTTCYDNSSNASNPMQYSTSQNSGNGINCALSFKF